MVREWHARTLSPFSSRKMALVRRNEHNYPAGSACIAGWIVFTTVVYISKEPATSAVQTSFLLAFPITPPQSVYAAEKKIQLATVHNAFSNRCS